jgi:fatty acid desaturase
MSTSDSNPRLIIRLFGEDVDVEDWQHKHPGGSKLLKIFANRDATQQFTAIHKGRSAQTMLNSMKRVKSSVTSTLSAADKEFQELIKKLEPELNRVNPVYELLKLSYIMGFFFGGYALCFLSHKYLGLSMMCLAIYQSGWVGHDYSHRSILSSPKYNNYMADFLGFIQGYSDIWWKMRHNTHHMTTNEVGNDPDVKTEPVFHFYDKITAALQETYQQASDDDKKLMKHRRVSKKHIPSQSFYFPFMLALLDVFWRYESILILSKNTKKYKWYIVLLGMHYLLMGALLICSPVTILDFIVLSLVKGFMTATVVFANHYPEDRLPPDHKLGLFEQTLLTSRNTTGLLFHHAEGPFRQLFNEGTGYLSMQIEHHLVPTWPSGNLMKLRPHIMDIARRHNLPYHETSILQASMDNLTKLSGSALENLKHLN